MAFTALMLEAEAKLLRAGSKLANFQCHRKGWNEGQLHTGWNLSARKKNRLWALRGQPCPPDGTGQAPEGEF